jgi:hypothetical protein
LAKGILWTRFHKVLKISLCYELAWFSVRQTLKTWTWICALFLQLFTSSTIVSYLLNHFTVDNWIVPEDGISQQITLTILFCFWVHLVQKTLIIISFVWLYALDFVLCPYVFCPWEGHWMVSFQNLIRQPRPVFKMAFIT